MDQTEKFKEFWHFSLDAAWDQHERHPELSRGRCLAERTYLRTLLNSSENEIFTEACEYADSVEDKSCMEKLFPRICKRAADAEEERNANISSEFEPGRCFRYALTENNWCYIHIYNCKKPESFLADPEFVAENFRYIMEDAEKNHSCNTIYTVSWLNSFGGFLRFFPEEYHDNINLPAAGNFGPTKGWQGQFIDRRGWLNKKTAAYFLENGVYPYARVESHCSFAALRKHLKQLTDK